MTNTAGRSGKIKIKNYHWPQQPVASLATSAGAFLIE